MVGKSVCPWEGLLRDARGSLTALAAGSDLTLGVVPSQLGLVEGLVN